MLSVLMFFALTACGTDSKFEGPWYSANADLYEFSDGKIISENSKITLESGKGLYESYSEYDGYIKAFMPSLLHDLTTLYVVEKNGELVMADAPDSSGKIYLYKNRLTAEAIAKKSQQEMEKYLKEVDEKNDAIEKSIRQSKIEPIATDYDTVLLGDLKKHTIAIEGIVTSFEHTEYSSVGDTYSFDVWFWSNKNNQYTKDMLWRFDEDTHSSELINKIKNLEDGDKIKIITEVYEDNSFGSSKTTDIEIIEKVSLKDCGLNTQEENNENLVEENLNNNEERYVYIADVGTKYHSEYCRTLSKSKHRVLYNEAIKMGKTPCNICNPMP